MPEPDAEGLVGLLRRHRVDVAIAAVLVVIVGAVLVLRSNGDDDSAQVQPPGSQAPTSSVPVSAPSPSQGGAGGDDVTVVDSPLCRRAIALITNPALNSASIDRPKSLRQFLPGIQEVRELAPKELKPPLKKLTTSIRRLNDPSITPAQANKAATSLNNALDEVLQLGQPICIE